MLGVSIVMLSESNVMLSGVEAYLLGRAVMQSCLSC